MTDNQPTTCEGCGEPVADPDDAVLTRYLYSREASRSFYAHRRCLSLHHALRAYRLGYLDEYPIEDRIRVQARRGKVRAERALYRRLRAMGMVREDARKQVSKMWESREKERPSKTRRPSREAGFKAVSAS